MYGGAALAPVKVMLGCAAFWHTVVVPEMVAIGNGAIVIAMDALVAQVGVAVDEGVKL